jgi:hypothetical protein
MLLGCGEPSLDPGGEECDDSGPPNADPMALVTLADAESRKLQCNDGTPAGFYLRRGVGCGAHRWIIHLQGGAMCRTNEECDARAADSDTAKLMTSSGWPRQRSGDGILSNSLVTNPEFANGNHVYIPYCSSDFWSGDREADPSSAWRHFRGARIFRAVIDALAEGSEGLTEAEEVVLSGSSAGGMGVLVHLDWLASERLPGVRVRGITDAGWFLNRVPFGGGAIVAEQEQAGFLLWNAFVDTSCAATHPGTEGTCYLADAYADIAAPLFVQINQTDPVQLGELGLVVADGIDQAECDYRLEFAAAIRTSLPADGVFCPAARTHVTLANEHFAELTVDGDTLRDVVGRWFFDRPGATRVVAAAPTDCS